MCAKGNTQSDGEGITIAVTAIKIEMISSGITQPISIQFSVIRNQREGKRENENKNTYAYQEREEAKERNCWISTRGRDIAHFPI